MTKSRNILIVEDEPIVQLHLQRIVSNTGHRVSGTATNAQQALEAAEREAPELVLMDIHLPGGIDGVEVARTLCERHDCGVVFATAFADPATLERTEDIGAAGYVVKPFTDAEVGAAIRTAVAGRERLRRSQRRNRSLSSLLRNRDEGVLMTDRSGRVLSADATSERITGCASRDARGRDLVDVLALGGEHRQEVERTVQRCLTERRAGSLRGVWITSGDGRRRRIDVDFDAITAEPDEGAGLVVALRDRTPRPVVATGRRAAVQRFGAGTRMLVYSHDTFGLGHLQRCRNLIRPLLERNPELSVLLVTGSSMAHRYELPPGADYVKLPAVRKVGPEHYEARSLSLPQQRVLALRSNLFLRTVRDYQPSLLLVDHAPVGMNGEIRPALEWLRQVRGCTTILGMRDIIDQPRSVVSLWQEQDVYGVLRDLYDHVLIYGDREIYDAVSAYAFPEDVAAKARFTHYVAENAPDRGRERTRRGSDQPRVVVSIGGGDGGVDSVIHPILEMLRRRRSEIGFLTEIVMGPLLPGEEQARVRQAARGLPVVLREYVESTTGLFRDADLVISTGGYNTVTQLLAHARRAIVIPRILHRDEQLIRARRLMELGLLTMIHPDEVEPERLFESIQRLLGDPTEPLTRGRATERVRLDGAKRVADFCEGLALGTSTPCEAPR